jgi:hypothetical protein
MTLQGALRKLRIVFLLVAFYLIYTRIGEVWGFIWALYFIYNDLSDVEVDIGDMKTKQEERNKNFSEMMPKRKNF